MLLLGASAGLASAQNVIVIMNDGSTHKFNADYLKEIKFQEAPATLPVIEFTNVDLSVYSGGNVTVKLSNEAGDTFELDLYGPMDAPWLHTGIYSIDGTNQPYTFDPSYTSLKVGETTGKPVGGTVEITLDGHQYTIEATLLLESGEEFKGKYVGEIPTYTQWLNVAMSAASYSPLEQAPGNFFVKLNDPDWKYEMALAFVADADAKELPAGTYTFDETVKQGALTPKSYVDTFNPNANLRLEQGSFVVVERDGDKYKLTMNLNLSDGRIGEFTYEGAISGTPLFSTPVAETVTFESIDVNPYSGGNTGITLTNPAEDLTVALDCYGSASTTFFETGEYIVGGADGLFIDTSIAYTYVKKGEETIALTGGTMTVSREGTIYTLLCDFTLADGSQFKGEYVGKLNKFAEQIDLTMSAAKYNENPMSQGEFYVKMNDADWNCEMVIDFFADKDATLLPAGTYTYSDAKTPGTFGPLSVVDLYNPSTSNRMTEGSVVNVEEINGIYTITMHLLFTDGRIADFNYNGEISGTPSFE